MPKILDTSRKISRKLVKEQHLPYQLCFWKGTKQKRLKKKSKRKLIYFSNGWSEIKKTSAQNPIPLKMNWTHKREKRKFYLRLKPWEDKGKEIKVPRKNNILLDKKERRNLWNLFLRKNKVWVSLSILALAPRTKRNKMILVWYLTWRRKKSTKNKLNHPISKPNHRSLQSVQYLPSSLHHFKRNRKNQNNLKKVPTF